MITTNGSVITGIPIGAKAAETAEKATVVIADPKNGKMKESGPGFKNTLPKAMAVRTELNPNRPDPSMF